MSESWIKSIAFVLVLVGSSIAVLNPLTWVGASGLLIGVIGLVVAWKGLKHSHSGNT